MALASVGDDTLRTPDADTIQEIVEQLTGLSNKGMTGRVFLISRILPYNHKPVEVPLRRVGEHTHRFGAFMERAKNARFPVVYSQTTILYLSIPVSARFSPVSYH